MPKPHPFYKRQTWLRLRRAQLRREPLCQICLEHGRVTPATVADHIVPWRDINTFLLGELRSLCASCHSSLSRPANTPRRWIGEDGYPVP